jgi:protein tyrosine phosphatase (PTP) superfamily phosphohydrolase (DUF442 family)
MAPRAAVAVPPPCATISPPVAQDAASTDVRSFPPPGGAQPEWRPAPGVRLDPPERGAPPEERPRLKVDENEGGGSGGLPVDIPQFAIVKKNVANGLRPTSAEGIDWLKKNGYRMALYLRRRDDSDDADRKQFEEKNGLKYASLTVSPDSLSQDLVDEFNKIVADSANQPLFVYDKTGLLAGALWYLHFRIVDRQSDEEARTIAGRLGLKDDDKPENREMWLAIQRLMAKQQKE